MTRIFPILFVFITIFPAAGPGAQERIDLEKLPPAERRRLLARYDLNGNGKLDGDEQKAARRSIERRKRWKKMFKNRPMRRGPRFQRTKISKKFDADSSGWLNRVERDQARAWLKENPQGRGGPGGFGGRRGRFGRPQGERDRAREAATPLKPVRPGDVPTYPDHGLYDPSILRTLFLEFAAKDWDQELSAFYRTDVEVPATLRVDGKEFAGTGVRYRGNSSYFAVPAGQKRSLNLSVDFIHGKQRLHGHRTLNLLNAHTDPSFLREVLYSQICRHYIPAPAANFVRLVINGEDWGVYVNVQQVNKDFLQERFGTKKGVRWKVPPDFSGGGALKYLGGDVAAYKPSYDLKTNKGGDKWPCLVRLCKVLEETPAEHLEAKLPPLLDVDEALWFLALDNVFMDDDGYYSRGSDYYLYLDKTDRFHLIPHDNNETFRTRGMRPGGGGFRGPPGGFPGPGPDDLPFPPARDFDRAGEGGGFDQSPVEHADNPNRPVIHRLLAVPAWRARYLAHVRTLVEEWLDWKVLESTCRKHRKLLEGAIRYDRKKLYTFKDFQKSLDEDVSEGFRRTPSLKRFVEERRKYLLAHPTMKAPCPGITSVVHEEKSGEGGTRRLHVRVHVGGGVPLRKVLLHYKNRRLGPFISVVMRRDGKDGVYVASTPWFHAGTKLRYYVEACAAAETGTTSFHPAGAEAGAVEYRFQP